MTPATQHLWIAGGDPRYDGHDGHDGRDDQQPAPTADVRADCHRRLRGPYTGMGSLLRALVPAAHDAAPDLVARHRIEILFAAPELSAVIGPLPATLTMNAPAGERTRWFSHSWTRRIAHGVVDLLGSWAALRESPPLVLALDRLAAADPTDQEFVAVALRRLDPARVRLLVHTGTGPALTAELAAALDQYAAQVEDARSEQGVDRPAPEATADHAALARRFVWSDGTSVVRGEQEAHDRQGRDDPAARAALHDARADELERSGEVSWRLGAIPYHRVHGGDPCGAGSAAIAAAQEHCLNRGFYGAVIEHGRSFEELLERFPDEVADQHYPALTRLAPALITRPDEYEAIQRRIVASTTHPQALATAYYALAVLHTRLLAEDRRNHVTATGMINTAIALAATHEDPAYRAFHTVFMENGLALIEMHLGELGRALDLVTNGLRRLDRELAPDQHRLHRSVLRYNRAQLLAALGRLDEALADFGAVIDADPNYAEYHFDRGNALRKLGRSEEAVANYERAMRLTPPFPELYHNRGDARLELGDLAGAAADFGYVLDLEPDNLESRVSLATLLLDTGDVRAAHTQAQEGLEHHPGDARLLWVVGQAGIESGDPAVARQAFDAALRADPQLYQALVSRAALACEQGDPDGAVADLDRALALTGDDPDLLYNRGYALEAAGRHVDAVADYTRALDLPGADPDELRARLDACDAVLAAAAGPGRPVAPR